MSEKHDNHNTGSIGLFFVCYQLARRGWNVMPTARNARGVDVLAVNDAGTKIAVQVKTLSARDAVNISNIDELVRMADFLVVVLNARTEAPECYVLTTTEAKPLVREHETRPWIPVGALADYLDKWDALNPKPGAGALPK
jgi:hypothetical protein